MSKYISLLTLFAAVLAAREASSRPCNPTMAYVASNLSNTWENSAGRSGMKWLFVYDSTSPCLNCHTTSSAGVPQANRIETAGKFCFNCHGGGGPASVRLGSASGTAGPEGGSDTIIATLYPDWLRFDSQYKLKRRSYHNSGFNKAYASMVRVAEGSMPPRGTNDSQWCDELQVALGRWLLNDAN